MLKRCTTFLTLYSSRCMIELASGKSTGRWKVVVYWENIVVSYDINQLSTIYMRDTLLVDMANVLWTLQYYLAYRTKPNSLTLRGPRKPTSCSPPSSSKMPDALLAGATGKLECSFWKSKNVLNSDRKQRYGRNGRHPLCLIRSRDESMFFAQKECEADVHGHRWIHQDPQNFFLNPCPTLSPFWKESDDFLTCFTWLWSFTSQWMVCRWLLSEVFLNFSSESTATWIS